MKREKRTPKANRLIHEKSPYLLQHAHNPVDWFPWGEEAFEKARKENKPIFLSIGYSTCHWCHVMEEESFEDETVAELLNSMFVAIKVDREERPDIDQTYMTAAQIMTGHGGWPLTIIMTPDKKPFFAGTYIPKESRFGRVGLIDLLKEINRIWREESEKVNEVAEKVSSLLLSSMHVAENNEDHDLEELLQIGAQALEILYDDENGGFGKAPKFPTPHKLMFLLRIWLRTKDEKYLAIVEKTLQQMRKGGIFDQIGFGFHRYSTDQRWILPHFEKMLYDQAMLLLAYAEAFAATRDEFYKKVCLEVLDYLKDQLLAPQGGFYSAEDADSEGEEGRFYTWSLQELAEVLGEKEQEIVKTIFDLREEGNFAEEATGEFIGRNVLFFSKNWDETAQALGIEEKQVLDKWKVIRRKLFTLRQKKIRPHKDDKILTDWNGLMIAALAISARILNDGEFLKLARNAAEFIIENMIDDDFLLLHRYRDGEAGIEGFLDDYAFLMWGLVELFETVQNPKYLMYATKLAERMVNDFSDSENGGFFFTTIAQSNEVLFRNKEFFDAAIPSGNSIAFYALLKLARITGTVKYERFAEKTLQAAIGLIKKAPQGFSMLLLGADFLVGPTFEVIIVARSRDQEMMRVYSKINSIFQPRKTVIIKIDSVDNKQLEVIAPYLGSYALDEEEIKIYVCRNQVCDAPTSDVEKALSLLSQDL